MKSPIHIALVDDHALFRAGIRSLLSAFDDMQIVAEAASAEEALDLLPSFDLDVLLLDVSLPGMNGIAALGPLTRRLGDVGIVLLTMHRDEEYLASAIRAGATGYLQKDCSPAELELAVRSVAAGRPFVSPSLAKPLFRAYADKQQDVALLTERQINILAMLARGLTAKQIAARINLSVKTVEGHRAQIMERIGVRSVAALVLYAVRNGLVGADSPEGP